MSTSEVTGVVVGAIVEKHHLNQSYRSLIHTRNKIAQRLTKDVSQTERMVLESLLGFVEGIMNGKAQKDIYEPAYSIVQILFDLESAHTMLVEGAHAQIQELLLEQGSHLESPADGIVDTIKREIKRRKA